MWKLRFLAQRRNKVFRHMEVSHSGSHGTPHGASHGTFRATSHGTSHNPSHSASRAASHGTSFITSLTPRGVNALFRIELVFIPRCNGSSLINYMRICHFCCRLPLIDALRFSFVRIYHNHVQHRSSAVGTRWS